MNTGIAVGRIGGLAVALGVGLGLSTGCAVAYADESGGAANSHSAPDPSSSTPTSTRSGDAASATSAGATSPVGGSAGGGSAGGVSRQRQPTDTSPQSPKATRGAADFTTTDVPSAELVEPAPDDAAGTATRRAAIGVQLPEPAAEPSAGEGRNREPAPHAVSPSETDTAPAAEVSSGSAADVVPLAAAAADPADTEPARAAGTGSAAMPSLVLSAVMSPAVDVSSAPVLTAQATPGASAAPTRANSVAALANSMFSLFSVGPLAAGSPLAPVQTPALWGLLAWARREFERTLVISDATAARTVPTLTTAEVAPMAASVPLPAAATTPTTTAVGWLTGPGTTGPNRLPRTNNTAAMFGIAGTDVAIMWDNGIADDPATPVDEHQILIAFGDTFSGTGMTGTWRSNTLLRSADRTPADGITVSPGVIGDIFSGSPLSAPNFARQIITSPGYLGSQGKEVTIIPTSGISFPYQNAYGSRQYVTYMSVKSWDTPGRWTTNYAAIAYSDDNGQTWTVAPSSIRSAANNRTTTGYISGNQNFQQSAFVRSPAGSADADYVYMFGTPSGRGGTIYLSRVKQTTVLDQTKYEYWNGSAWVLNKPSAATPILPGTTSGFWIFASTTYPTAGEMSVQYNSYLQKYVMMYTDSANNVVMRTAGQPQGPWSAPTTLVTSNQYQGLYSPMMHPWTADQDIYWNMSMWGDYNVLLMHTRLV